MGYPLEKLFGSGCCFWQGFNNASNYLGNLAFSRLSQMDLLKDWIWEKYLTIEAHPHQTNFCPKTHNRAPWHESASNIIQMEVAHVCCQLQKTVPKFSLWNLRRAEILEVWRILTTDGNNVAQVRLKKSHNCQMVSPWVPAPPVPPSLPSTHISPPCHFRPLKMLEHCSSRRVCLLSRLQRVKRAELWYSMILMMWSVETRFDKPRLGQVMGQRLAESSLGLRSRGSEIQGWAHVSL